MKKIKYIFVMGLASFLSFSSLHFLRAEDIKVKYDGQEYNYDGIQVKYHLNGTELPSIYPGIIIDDISLASMDEIFVFSNFGATYKINRKNGEIIIRRGKDELLMKLDSYEAKFNGNIKWAPLKPRMIQMPDGKEKLYVPARFLASSFGFRYYWNPINGVASIEGEVAENKNILSILENGKIKEYKAPGVLFYSGKNSLNSEKNPGIYIGSKLFAPSADLFLNSEVEGGYFYDEKKKNLILEFDNKVLSLKVGKTEGKLNKKIIKLKSKPLSIKYNFSGKSDILIPIEEIGKIMGWKISVKDNRAEIILSPLQAEEKKTEEKKMEEKKVEEKKTEEKKVEEKKVEEKKAEEKKTEEKKVEEKKVEEKKTEEKKAEEKKAEEKKIEEKESDDKKIEKIESEEKNLDKKKEEGKKTSEIKNEEKKKSSPNKFSWQTKNPDYLTYHSVTHINVSDEMDGEDEEAEDIIEENSENSDIQDIIQIEESKNGKFDTYFIVSNNPFSEISSEVKNKTLLLNFTDYSIPKNKRFFFREGGMALSAEAFKRNDSTALKFALSEDVYYHSLSLSDDKRILTVKIIRHGILSVKERKNKGKYEIVLKGTGKLEVDSLDRIDQEILRFSLTMANHTMEDSHYVFNDKNNVIHSISYISEGDKKVLQISKNPAYAYFITENKKENEVSIIFDKLENFQYSANIILPKNLKNFTIKDEDNYLNNNFSITLPFRLSNYFKENPFFYDEKKVERVEILETNQDETKIVFYLKEMNAYQIIKQKSFIGIKIGKANEFYKKVVVIDPGHGAHDTGALGGGGKYREKDIVSAVGYTYLSEYLKKSDIKVYWTRKEDGFMQLTDRAKFASRIGADLFLSIHANAAASKKANGTETYYSVRNNVIQSNGLSSYELASILQKNFTSSMKTVNRGVKSNIFIVTNMNTVPAVLLELGFMTNEKDLSMLVSPEKQNEMAKTIFTTLEEIFTKYPTGR